DRGALQFESTVSAAAAYARLISEFRSTFGHVSSNPAIEPPHGGSKSGHSMFLLNFSNNLKIRRTSHQWPVAIFLRNCVAEMFAIGTSRSMRCAGDPTSRP